MEFFDTLVGPRATELVTSALMRRRVSEGELVLQFEQTLSERFGIKFPLALNSGTSALHLALVLARVGPGDEVIVPPQTFIATALAVLMVGAIPVFADIDPSTGNIEPSSVETSITERTRAVIPVHWGGLPCDLMAICSVAQKHHIAVVEDAAHAFGAMYRGRPIGSISDFTCFSFQAIKHFTTGDGGLLACSSKTSFERGRQLRWFGIDRARAPLSELGERQYDLTEVGYKYHMNDLAAALGIAGLDVVNESLQRRRWIADTYRRELSAVPGVTMLREPTESESACWLFPLRVEKRSAFVRALAAREVPTSVVHRRIDRHTLFGGVRDSLVGMNAFDETQIHLPIHSMLTDNDVQSVINAVRSGW